MLKARQASARPATARESCQATWGFSGLPKLRQFVSPSGSAPTQARLRAHSSTASTVPVYGSHATRRPLQSIAVAIAPLPPSTSRASTAASDAPERRTEREPTIVSYCSYAQRLLAIVGAESRASKVSEAAAPSASTRGGSG